MGTGPIRLLIVDDHALFREGLRQLLAAEGDLEVVGEAATGREVLERVRELAPDIVLMDIALPGLDGLAATQLLRHHFPGIRVVMVTMYEAGSHAEAARAAGASAYVVKSSRPEDLFQAIRSVATGQGLSAAPLPAEPGDASPALRGEAVPRSPTSELARLTYLERRVRWLEDQLAQLRSGRRESVGRSGQDAPPHSRAGFSQPGPPAPAEEPGRPVDHTGVSTLGEPGATLRLNNSTGSAKGRNEPPAPTAAGWPTRESELSALAKSTQLPGALPVRWRTSEASSGKAIPLKQQTAMTAESSLSRPGIVWRAKGLRLGWLSLAFSVILLTLLNASLLVLPLGALSRFSSVGGLLTSLVLFFIAARGLKHPVRAHLLILLAIVSAASWTVWGQAHSDNPFAQFLTVGFAGLTLTYSFVTWQRGFLAALAVAGVVLVLVPAQAPGLTLNQRFSWSLGVGILITFLAWWALRRQRHSVAWEWLPFAPFAGSLPILFQWAGEYRRMSLLSPDSPSLLVHSLLLAVPSLVPLPVLWQAARKQRRARMERSSWKSNSATESHKVSRRVNGLILVHALLLLLSFSPLFNLMTLREQAALLVALGSMWGLLATLLYWADASAPSTPLAAWELAAAFASAGILAAALRHPEPLLPPIATSALSLLIATAHREKRWRQYLALLLYGAAALMAFSFVARETASNRSVVLVLAILASIAASGGTLLTDRLLRWAWLSIGSIILTSSCLLRLDWLHEIASLSSLTLAGLLLIRAFQCQPSTWPQARWGWFPVLVPATAALGAALKGPLSPGQLGLALRPTVTATSDPVLAAAILVTTALVAGRLLGRLWHGPAIALALLIVAYLVPAILPDGAVILSWLALALVLFHFLDRPQDHR